MDLIDIFERLFRGIVYFVYNLVESVVTVIRHPIQGPFRLHRLHMKPDAKQIGGMTFLFLGFVVLYWTIMNALSSDGSITSLLAKVLTDASANAPRLDVNAIWPNLLASLISTIGIDAALRLLLRWRLPDAHTRRRYLLAAAEYAILWMIVAALATTVIYWILLTHDAPDTATRIQLGLGAIGLLASSVPAAHILRILIRKSGRRLDIWQMSVGMVALSALFAAAALAGLAVGQDVLWRRASFGIFDYHTHVETLRCEILPDGRIALDGFVYIRNAPPRAMRGSDFSLVFESIEGQRIGNPFGIDLEWRRPGTGPYAIVGENQLILVDLVTPKPVPVIPDEASCRLDGWYVKTEELARSFEGRSGPALPDDGRH